jgi:hypothetical protein
MRIAITHNKTVAQVIESADQAVDQVFKGLPLGPVEIVEQQKHWSGGVMTFHLTAKVGPLKYPLRGTVEVTERQCIVDVDLMAFGRLLPNKAQELIEARWRGLLT